MLVSVQNLPSEGKVIALRFPREEVGGLLAASAPEDVRAAGELVGEVKILPSGRDAFVMGTIRSRVVYGCVRCLEEFEDDVATDFHRVYTESPAEEPGEVELHREDMDIEAIRGGMIDLTEAVTDELSLALKPYPVCREDCLGLCPVCGENRNLVECRCEGREVDPRFSALEALSGK